MLGFCSGLTLGVSLGDPAESGLLQTLSLPPPISRNLGTSGLASGRGSHG